MQESMTVAELAAPAREPGALAEIKAQLRLESDDEDGLLDSLILAARQHLEAETGLCLISRRLRHYLDAWPADGLVRLGRGPVQALLAITVYDAEGLPRALALDRLAAAGGGGGPGLMLDGVSRPARLLLPPLPDPGRALNGIEIDVRAGFGDDPPAVPEALRRALIQHVAALHACRGAVAPEDQPALVPAGYDRLIAPFCRRRL